MSVQSGARAYRQQHKRLREEELPSTDTEVQRGRLMARAAAGDKAAKRALQVYREQQAAQ